MCKIVFAASAVVFSLLCRATLTFAAQSCEDLCQNRCAHRVLSQAACMNKCLPAVSRGADRSRALGRRRNSSGSFDDIRRDSHAMSIAPLTGIQTQSNDVTQVYLHRHWGWHRPYYWAGVGASGGDAALIRAPTK